MIAMQKDKLALDRAAAKATRKGRPLKVYTSGILGYFLERGWTIASHTPSSYASGNVWYLRPPQG